MSRLKQGWQQALSWSRVRQWHETHAARVRYAWTGSALAVAVRRIWQHSAQVVAHSRLVTVLRGLSEGAGRRRWWLTIAMTGILVEGIIRTMLQQMTPAGVLWHAGWLALLLGWRRLLVHPAAGADATPVVVRLIARLNIGGPARQVIRLTEAMNRQGVHEYLLHGCVADQEGDLADRAAGLPVHVLPTLRRELHLWRDLVAWWQILGYLRRYQPRVLHTHTAKAGALGRTAAWVYNTLLADGAPHCCTVHTFHGHVLQGYFAPWKNWCFAQVERLLARITDQLVAVSETVRQDLLALRIGRPAQVMVVRVGVELSGFAVQATSPGAGRLRIGFVGRLAPVKNPALFLEGARRLLERRVGAPLEFVIVGDGELRSALSAWTQAHGLADDVVWWGWRHDLPAVYAQLPIVCCTSVNEGTPTALIEALAAGCAVISTDVGGVRDVVGAPDGPHEPGRYRLAEAGLLIRSGDVEGLVAAWQRLIDDPALRAQLAARGRQRAQQFAMTRMIDDYQRLYAQLWHPKEQTLCTH